MYPTDKATSLHPNLVEVLFANKNEVSQVFNDVLGLYGISHIALSHIDNNKQLLALSSTPSLEFNLFNSYLWRYDKTYQHSWYSLCTIASWQSLYSAEHYDDLYYMKQIKHAYSLGFSFAVKQPSHHVIFSFASDNNCQQAREIFTSQHDNFYKIGQYCINLLLPLFNQEKTV